VSAAAVADTRVASRARRLTAGISERRLGQLAAISLAALVASAVAIVVGAAARWSFFVPAGKQGWHRWLVGPFQGVGPSVTGGELFALLVLMSAAYAGVLCSARRLRWRWLLTAIVGLHALFALAPPLISQDVFSYIDYARMGALHALDPYAHTPAALPRDPVYHFVGWRHVETVYGPLFTLGSYPLAFLGVAGALWAFKLTAASASLACVALVWWIAGRTGRDRARAAAIFGLNPLVLVYTVGGAHNDLLMLAALLAGVALVLSSREALGGACVVIAAAIKASAGLALPFVALGARRGWRVALGAAVAGGVALAVAVLAFPGHSVSVFGLLRHEQVLVSSDSPSSELAQLVGLPRVTAPVRLAAHVFLAGSCAWIAVRVWRGGEWIGACGWAFNAFVIGWSWLLGWYTVWALPFAATSRSRRLLAATLALEAYFVANRWRFVFR
jgi:Glycosyltransferase family 87